MFSHTYTATVLHTCPTGWHGYSTAVAVLWLLLIRIALFLAHCFDALAGCTIAQHCIIVFGRPGPLNARISAWIRFAAAAAVVVADEIMSVQSNNWIWIGLKGSNASESELTLSVCIYICNIDGFGYIYILHIEIRIVRELTKLEIERNNKKKRRNIFRYLNNYRVAKNDEEGINAMHATWTHHTTFRGPSIF